MSVVLALFPGTNQPHLEHYRCGVIYKVFVAAAARACNIRGSIEERGQKPYIRIACDEQAWHNARLK